LRFSDAVWAREVEPLISRSMGSGRELGAQLCEVDGVVHLGRVLTGDSRGIAIPHDFFECEQGRWVGDLHVEVLPHFPPYPSDEDIENDWNWVKGLLRIEPYTSCVCSAAVEPAPKFVAGKPVVPESGVMKMGCFCEEWHPWGEEEHNRVLERAKPYWGAPFGGFYLVVRGELLRRGHIKGSQLQWGEASFVDRGKKVVNVSRGHKVYRSDELVGDHEIRFPGV